MSWEQTISTLGFPIAMCIYFMFRTEKIIQKNTEAVNQLACIVEKLIK